MATMKRERTPQRTALADAIVAAEAAATSLAEAEAAHQNATIPLHAAFREQEEMERLHRDLARNNAAEPSDYHSRLIAALAGGSDVEVPSPPPDRLMEVTQRLEAVEKDIAKWREIRAIAEQEIRDRRATLESAQREIDKAASAVVVSTVDVEKLIDQTLANIARLRQLNRLKPDDERLHVTLQINTSTRNHCSAKHGLRRFWWTSLLVQTNGLAVSL